MIATEEPMSGLPPRLLKLSQLLPGNDISPFSVFTPFYENEIAKANGGRNLIEHADNGITAEELESCARLAPFFRVGLKKKELLELLNRRYNSITFPCSLKVSDTKEFETHVLNIYQVANAHYVLGKHDDFSFPHMCCGSSGRNVAASLWAIGYPSAAYVYDRFDDHGYTIVPFKLAGKTEGVVMLDPTSDQLWNGLDKQPRNAVSVFLERRWEYKTHWQKGADLYPDVVMHVGIMKKILVKNWGLANDRHYDEPRSFLEKAFDNPIPFMN